LVSRTGPRPHDNRQRLPGIVSTLDRGQSLGHWRSRMVSLSEDKATDVAALNVNCTALVPRYANAGDRVLLGG
jgi:hypothetical protein